MDKTKIKELIEKFNLKNDLTPNKNIWVGHAKIGYRNRLTIEEAKNFLSDMFQTHIKEGEPTPKELIEILEQWEDYHPYQKVREIDQPMFISQKENIIFVAVIWPWQIKEGVASLMIYQGEID